MDRAVAPDDEERQAAHEPAIDARDGDGVDERQQVRDVTTGDGWRRPGLARTECCGNRQTCAAVSADDSASG